MLKINHTTLVNTVPVLNPFDSTKEALPDLGEGATVVITASYYGSRSRTLNATIQQVKPFTSASVPGYSDTLYGLRCADGSYQVMFAGELKRRLVGYVWSK